MTSIQAGDPAAKLYYYKANVQRVIDGDTVVLNVDLGFGAWLQAQNFRLLGINAREKSQEGGKEARDNLATMLPHGTEVTVRTIKADKYGGRYDAMVQLADGTDLSNLLIETGWAAPWDGRGERALPDWPRSQ